MNILRGKERQGVIFRAASGWHWIVTTGRMAGRADLGTSATDAKLTLRRMWRKGRRIMVSGRELIG